MKFDGYLEQGKLVKRYKRFLADVETQEGKVVTIHCPNTGSMKNCAEPGFGVWFSESQNKKRKYPNTWELAENFDGHFIGINTTRANKLAKEAIESGWVNELDGYDAIKAEVKYGEENSRIDLLLSKSGHADCYVEIKSVTLKETVSGEDGSGFFPDSVSTRGQKHLRELAKIARNGERAVLLYCVQHTGIKTVAPAGHIDPDYKIAMKEAVESGVEVLVYGCAISPTEIKMNLPLEFVSI